MKNTEHKGLVDLSNEQLDQVTGGISPAARTQNPNDLNNGTNANSNGRSGAPGNSFHPGH
jgi:hypothetical protein